MVYVLSKDGKPLMPCENVIARLLLKQGKARVKMKTPFTIRLNYETTNYTQDCCLGLDTGSKHVGCAVSSDKKVLYQSQVELRDDIKGKMNSRRQYRKGRRNRKTRYRRARFLNRKNSTKKDRLPPSVRSKIDSHIKEIEFCKSILPITDLVFEMGQFDPHLLKHENEAFNRHWGYQKGVNYGFESRKAYVLSRDEYTCQHCGKKHVRLEVHHVIWKSKGGTDDENNLITLCVDCHWKVHNAGLVLKQNGKKNKGLKHATQMNVIRSQLLKQYPEVIETYGFVTKANRYNLGIPKEHYLDAVVISTGGVIVKLSNEVFYKKSVAYCDRALTKGIRGEQKITIGKIKGFNKFDKVRYKGNEYFIKGRMSTGYAVLMNIFGTKQVFDNPKTVKLVDCKRIESRRSILCQRTAV